MTHRTRRAVLTLGAGAVAALAGCSAETGDTGPASPQDTEETPDGTGTPTDGAPSVPTLSFNHAGKLHRQPAGFPQRDVASYYLALLRTRDHASAFPTDRLDEAAAGTFLADTDFSRAAVLVLQDRKSSSHPDLELVDLGRDGRVASLAARYPGDARTTDVTTDTLLVRMPTTAGPVRGARATIHRQYGDPDSIGTANRYDTLPAFDPAGDLVVRNRDCSTAGLSVTVTYRGELFFRDGLDLAPASSRRVGGVFSYPGEWTVTAGTADTGTSRTWSLTDGQPGDVLVDVAGDGEASLSRHPSGVDGGDLAGCETDGYPYESPTPAENLADPVDLLVLDRAERGSDLTVTIADGDTRVYRDTFETAAGLDKHRRADLLARKATYTVSVSAADGRATSERVTVGDGAGDLVVRVTESGNLAVSLD